MSLPKRHIITTGDGSKTLQVEGWDEQYHSKHGAVQEAIHVFIKSGVHSLDKKQLGILEIGFGTGLNAFITYLEAQEKGLNIDYTGVEAYPVERDVALAMEYEKALMAENNKMVFEQMHSTPWEKENEIAPFFKLIKKEMRFQEIDDKELYDLIYFDAFGFRVQPELWSIEIFQKMYDALKLGGKLVTYAAKGEVRRNMQAVGFTTERLPGPPGKREMLRATK